MDTLRLLWFFLWRMTLWGLVLGAAVGVVYLLGTLLIGAGITQLAWIPQNPGQIGGS